MKTLNKTMMLLALVLAMLLVPAGSLSAKTYLVAVGVGQYKNQNPLRYTVRDAQTVKYIYDQNGNAETIVLADAQATKDNVVSTMRRLFSKAKESDIVILFFSGHGYHGGFCLFDGNLSYTSIRKAMASSRSKNKMIFADTCFSGGMRQGRGGQDSEARKMNVLLFLSSRPGEESIESQQDRMGLFTLALQRALSGGADANRDRVITARELFTYVSAKVAESSRNQQHPVMWGRFSNSMPVIRW